MLIEPMYSLQKGLFLCELDRRLGKISSNSEAMLCVRVEIDLPWNRHLQEQLLSMMTLLGSENLIGF
jgi:hypothetical protein